MNPPVGSSMSGMAGNGARDGNAFFAVCFRQRIFEFCLKVCGQVDDGLGVLRQHRDDGAFGQGRAREHDLAFNDGTGDELHDEIQF